jgi:hypothetical protein
MPNSLKYLLIINVNLNDTGMEELAKLITKILLETLDISQNNFSIDGWSSLISSLFRSTVATFITRNNLLSPEHLKVFTASLVNSTRAPFERIDIGDNQNLDDASLIDFVDACAKSGLKTLVLSNTEAGDAVAFKIASLLKSGSLFEHIDIDDTKISRVGLLEIIKAAVGSNLKILNSYHIALTDDDLYQVALLMLNAPVDTSYLGSKFLNEDQIRNLVRSIPALPLTRWDFTTTGPLGRGFLAFMQAQQYSYLNVSPLYTPNLPSEFEAFLQTQLATNFNNNYTDNLPAVNDSTDSSNGTQPNLIIYLVGVVLFLLLLKNMMKPLAYCRNRLFAATPNDTRFFEKDLEAAPTNLNMKSSRQL